MQIHEITESKKVEEALGGLGSFMSGLTGGMSDKYMDKTPGGVKPGLFKSGVNPADYGAGYQKPSAEWKDKYKAIQKDPTINSYVKTIAAGWAKNAPTAVKPTTGLDTAATLQKTVPTLVTAAKKTNNTLTSAQIGQILAQSAPTIWKNTPDRPDPAKPNQVDKSAAIKQLAAELIKQGVTVDGSKPAAATGTKNPTAVASTAKTQTGGKVAGQISQTPGAIAKRNVRAQTAKGNTAGASAFGQMANQLTGKAPNTMANAPISKVNIAKPGNPNQPQQAQVQKPTATFGKVPAPRVPAAPGQMPADVASSTQGRKMRQLYGKPRGGIQGMKSDLEEAVATGPAADKYKTAFVTWSDGQFATRVQETGATVTMNAVRKAFPDLAKDLSTKLDQIVAAQGTPQQSGAIEEYSKLAVAGVQALAQAGKNKESVLSQQQNVDTVNAGGNVKQSLRDVGVDPTRLSQFGEIAKQSGSSMTTARTNDPTANALLKLAGYTLT